jgi:flavin-dependent dehydrogenase
MIPDTDAMIVGGGPAGSALGILLASAGHRVTIIERSAGPSDRVCGEFYSGEAIQYLAALGIDLISLGALSITTVRLAAREMLAECALPFPGLSISRRVVDECLLSRAATAGAVVTRGIAVEGLTTENDQWLARLNNGQQKLATAAFVATGKHDLRGRRRDSGIQGDLVAFKMYFALDPLEEEQLNGCVELILFPGGYAGLQLVPGGHANLSLLIKKDLLRRHGTEWCNVLSHALASSDHLARRLKNGVALLPKPLALASIPYGYRKAATPGEPWFVGDQCAVIPSFTGDGMSIALHTAFVAASAWQQGTTALEYQEQIAIDLRWPVLFAAHLARGVISMPFLANGLRMFPETMRWIASQTRVPRPLLREALSSTHKTLPEIAIP